MATNSPARPGVFLTTEWRYLAMLSFAVEPALLEPHLPAGVELDLWNGRPYASVVGFVFRNTRLLGLPIPLHRNFPELNLRFYVRRPRGSGEGDSGQVDSGERGGVVFIREIVARRAVSLVARLVYNENFRRLPMRSRIEAGPTVEYAWRLAGEWNRLRMECAGPAERPAAASLAHFVGERSWGYSRQRDGGCLEYEVEHPPWNIWQPQRIEFHCDAERMYGGDWVEVLARRPDSAVLVDGSPIVLRRGLLLHSADATPAHPMESEPIASPHGR